MRQTSLKCGVKKESMGFRSARKSVIRFLVYSNIYISLAGAGMAVTTILLAGFPIRILPIFVAFTIPMFVYTLTGLRMLKRTL